MYQRTLFWCVPTIILLLSCLEFANSQQCNSTAYPYYRNQTVTLKSGLTNRLKIGMVGSFILTDHYTANSIAWQINNDPTILPDVCIDLYISATPTSSDVLLGVLYHINTLGIQGLIGGLTSTESRTAQLAAKIFKMPQISSNSLSSALSNKDEYPYFMRTIPADSVQIDGIVAIFKRFNWTKAIIIYTSDDYGSGYQRLTSAGAAHNITFYSVSVPNTATNASGVSDCVTAVKQAIETFSYRIFVYYAQSIPTGLVRAALNASGYIGPEFVTILTASNSGVNAGNNTLNEGVISLVVTKPEGPAFDKYYGNWKNSTTNPFPKPVTIVNNNWFMADALLSYVYTMDRLLKSGVPFASIKADTYFKGIRATNFTGTTGFVTYDSNGDRIGNYAVYSLSPTKIVQVATFVATTGQLVVTGDFVWGGGTTKVPRDTPYKCYRCQHGDCVTDVGCVCHKGYKGENCDVKADGLGIGGIAGGAAAGAVMIAILLGAFFFYRKKRYELVKEVSDKQRSNIARVDLLLQHRIGRGASGEVFKATFRGTEVAVKKIITSSVDKATIQEFELEVAIMCGLRHPNIILFMGSCFDGEGKEMLLVMEFMARGSLHDVLHNPKLNLNLEMKLHLACQAAQGMNFLHQSSPPIIHRDLKSHNILLDDKWNARISDFGITKFKENTKSSKSTTHEKSIGTIYWSAPEALEGLECSEKNDCYSFGIVLWEIFHRQNPYAGRDPVAVAIEVIHSNLRPPMSPDVPSDMQELIRACWDRTPENRPGFQEIMTSLRGMSMKNPSYLGGGNMRVEAPTGLVYLVNTAVQGAFALWESKPKAMCEAMNLHNGLIRSTMELYRGYESKYDFHAFMIAFATLEDAVNFSIATQVSMLHIPWPTDLLKHNACAEIQSSKGESLWNGLRVQMSIYSGVPNCEHDPSTDRMVYLGPVVDKAQKMLRGMRKGSVVVTDTIVDEINKKNVKFIQTVFTRKCGEMNDSTRANAASIHKLIIQSLHERETNSLSDGAGNDPHVLVDVEDFDSPPSAKQSANGTDRSAWEQNFNSNSVDWLVPYKDLELKETIGKGSMGDYQRATWKNKDVSIKTLINQKLKEADLLRLLSDSAMMSKMVHPNILTFYAVCLDSNHLAMISEYMARGNLKTMLADNSINLSQGKRIKMAQDIANGMSYLSQYPDEDMKKHDNLKSNNILIGKDWEVKICDYGQSNLKELARTMTSVGSVAWTAPELLTGDAPATARIAIYSFGIILWELYTRQVPYLNEHPIRVVSKILSGYRPQIPVGCPPALAQLITECLHEDPDQRPSWDMIISSLSNIMTTMM